MILAIEAGGERLVMEVQPFERSVTDLPAGISGMRMMNRIVLLKKYFDDFILALSIDDFEAVRAILGMVIDMGTRELCYPDVGEVLLLAARLDDGGRGDMF